MSTMLRKVRSLVSKYIYFWNSTFLIEIFWVVGCILYIEIAGKKTDQDSDKHWIEKINNMSFLNELIERSGAVSNACQSWHLWGMSLDFVVNWLKKKGNQYKKYTPILGYFIRKGAFYLERRRESRGWTISSSFFQPLLFAEVFFSRQLYMYTYIHSLLSQPTLHKFRVIDLSTFSNRLLYYILIYGVKLKGLLIWNWFQIHSKSVTSHKL